MAGTEIHLVVLVVWAPALGAAPGGRDTLPFGCGSRLAPAAPFPSEGSENEAYGAAAGGIHIHLMRASGWYARGSRAMAVKQEKGEKWLEKDQNLVRKKCLEIAEKTFQSVLQSEKESRQKTPACQSRGGGVHKI